MHPSWKSFLQSEFAKPYFKDLSAFLHNAYATTTVFPPKTQVFRAFTTDLNNIKVVILGQDPYHTPGVAHGLAFSVNHGQPLPPSLINIYKEIDSDLSLLAQELAKTTNVTTTVTTTTPPQTHHANPDGNLTPWQNQGVLLLNNVLTVEAHRAGSHRGKGWETFTEACIKYLNETRPHLVFILWGRDARNKKPLIDQTKHLILESPHPSPLSASRGFFGSRPFSQTNAWLSSHDLTPIIW